MARVSKIYSRMLTILIAWLGVSCNWINPGCEYGTPSASFKAKGVVTSQTDNKPIEGIRAVLKADDYSSYGIDTVYTDSKGAFSLKSRKDEFHHQKLYLELNDVDGDENGSFADKGIEIDYSNEKFTGGDGHWYRGEAEKDLGNVRMEPKE